MDEFDDELSEDPERAPNEGVRIIGAEEAARALEEGHAAGRRPEDAPKFGDVPQRPSGPRPAQRFPLPESVDPAEAVRRPAPKPSPPPASEPSEQFDTGGEVVMEPTGMEMPHWTEPPSGEVPRILASEPGDEGDEEAWSAYSATGPRWRDREEDWAESDMDALSLDEDLRLGALDTSRTEHSDLFSFDEPEIVADEPEVVADEPEPAPAPPAGPARIRTRTPKKAETAPPSGGDTGRRLVVGAAMAGAALVAFKLGSKPALFLAIVVVLLAAVEVYDVFRRAGYRTATLLGLTATLAIMLAAYSEGEVAIPLVIALTTVFTFFWYLFGVVRARPTINVAVTLMGFLWVGFLGSFGALLLAYPNREGIAFLLAAVIGTAGYDIGAFVVGGQMGSRALTEISPNKTVEGLIGGMLLAVFATTVIVGAVPGIHPWTVGKAFTLGLVVAVVAPLGDLCQSMIKRDLGLKDMGSLLPGHGGILDRFDSLLFVLPATYYLVKLVNLG